MSSKFYLFIERKGKILLFYLFFCVIIGVQKRVFMILKEEILTFLQKNATKPMGLSDIVSGIHADPQKLKSAILYHLRRFVETGKVRRQEDGTYIFIDKTGSETINILYVGDARAGSNNSFIDDEYGLTTIPVKSSLIKHDPKELILVSVKGDSMEPELPDHSLLLFKKYKQNETPKDGDVIFCRYDNGFKIKKFQKLNDSYFVLVSNNKKYAPILVDEHIDFVPKGKFITIIS